MPCDIEAIRKVLMNINGVREVSKGLSGEGSIRIIFEKDIALLELPKEAINALCDCDVIELAYPDGRVVYITREWVRRVAAHAHTRSAS